MEGPDRERRASITALGALAAVIHSITAALPVQTFAQLQEYLTVGGLVGERDPVVQFDVFDLGESTTLPSQRLQFTNSIVTAYNASGTSKEPGGHKNSQSHRSG